MVQASIYPKLYAGHSLLTANYSTATGHVVRVGNPLTAHLDGRAVLLADDFGVETNANVTSAGVGQQLAVFVLLAIGRAPT